MVLWNTDNSDMAIDWNNNSKKNSGKNRLKKKEEL
jgi:hypothetical protein